MSAADEPAVTKVNRRRDFSTNRTAEAESTGIGASIGDGIARRTDPTVLVDPKVGSVDDPIFDKAVDLVLHEPPSEECFDSVDTRSR